MTLPRFISSHPSGLKDATCEIFRCDAYAHALVWIQVGRPIEDDVALRLCCVHSQDATRADPAVLALAMVKDQDRAAFFRDVLDAEAMAARRANARRKAKRDHLSASKRVSA